MQAGQRTTIRLLLVCTLVPKLHLGTGETSAFQTSRPGEFPHGASGRHGQLLAIDDNLHHFLAHRFAQLLVSLPLARAVAHAAPRRQVRAIADVKTVGLAPTHKFQIAVFDFSADVWLGL